MDTKSVQLAVRVDLSAVWSRFFYDIHYPTSISYMEPVLIMRCVDSAQKHACSVLSVMIFQASENGKRS